MVVSDIYFNVSMKIIEEIRCREIEKLFLKRLVVEVLLTNNKCSGPKTIRFRLNDGMGW